jgi:small-conductance mechanosensitive channel
MLAALRTGGLWIALILVLGMAPGAAGQSFLIGPTQPKAVTAEPQSNAPGAPLTPAEKRAENAEQLRLAMRKLEASGNADSAAAHEVAYYQSLEAVLAQQEAVDKQIKDLQARKLELETQLKTPPTELPASCSFIELDQWKDELAAERARASLVDDKLDAAKVALERAQRAREEADSKFRQAQDAFERNKQREAESELAAVVEMARQNARLALETLTLRKQELAREQLAQEVQRLSVRMQQERVSRFAPLAVFSEQDYQAQLDDIAKKEEAANKALSRAQTRLQTAQVQLQEIQSLHDAETGDRTVLGERLKAQQLAVEKLTDEINSLTQRLQRLAQLRIAWQRRYQTATVYASTPDKQAWSELKNWQQETQSILDELARDLRTQIFRMRDLRSSLTSVTKKIDAANNQPEASLPWLQMQQDQLEALLRTREKDLVSIESSRRVHEKLLEEIGTEVHTLSAKTLALGTWYQAKRIWEFEFTSIDNKPVTVRTIVTGVVLFVGGWMVSRFLSALFANRLLKRFRLSKDGIAVIRTLVFYTLLTIVALWALKTINLPLTAFTILGGALAIGVGFGSQALINNFIGGLIMLAERPVRLGERINFGKYEGVVEDVGFRCTKLRTLTDHLVTIPNSTLVNESIENVARRRTIRRKMDITITYDTPRDKVAAAVQAIRDILQEKDIRERIHPIVGFEELTPRVFFNDFNAESLNILVIYWYAPSDWWAYLEHCERVNFRIMEEFARLGVEFAFPSRTVYLKPSEELLATTRYSANGNVVHPGQRFA